MAHVHRLWRENFRVPEAVYLEVPPDARQLPVASGSRAQSEGAGRHPPVCREPGHGNQSAGNFLAARGTQHAMNEAYVLLNVSYKSQQGRRREGRAYSGRQVGQDRLRHLRCPGDTRIRRHAEDQGCYRQRPSRHGRHYQPDLLDLGQLSPHGAKIRDRRGGGRAGRALRRNVYCQTEGLLYRNIQGSGGSDEPDTQARKLPWDHNVQRPTTGKDARKPVPLVRRRPCLRHGRPRGRGRRRAGRQDVQIRVRGQGGGGGRRQGAQQPGPGQRVHLPEQGRPLLHKM